MTGQALVSIGVPLYNDASWLRNALDHLLAQDYPNLEIVLADDGSTDDTRAICREYAKRDERIRFFANKHNLGPIDNHKFVFDVSTGDYFAWGSGHDYYLPTFVSRTLEELNANSALVQCCPKTIAVQNEKSYVAPGILDTRGLPAVERIKRLMDFRLSGGSMDIFYGLFRSEILGKLDIGRNSVSADEVLFAELSLLGEILQISDPLMQKVNTRGTTNVRANRASYRAHLDRQKLSKGSLIKEYLPRLYSFVEYMNMVDTSGAALTDPEKEYLYRSIKNEAANYTKNIEDELEYFIAHFREQIPACEDYPALKRIQAAQVLSALDFAYLLGFEYEGSPELRSLCLNELKLENQVKLTTRPARGRSSQPEPQEGARGPVYKLAARLRGILGERAWRILRRVLSLRFLLLIWIAGVMALYFLLFSPPQYWGVLSTVGMSAMLDAFRTRVVEFFDLAMGFH